MYKRQVYPYRKAGPAVEKIYDSLTAPATPKIGVATVSYTHLDVYKRQVEGCVVRRKDYATSEEFDAALLETLRAHKIDLVVLCLLYTSSAASR